MCGKCSSGLPAAFINPLTCVECDCMTRLAITVFCGAMLVATGCGRAWRTPDGSGTIEATEVRVAAEVPGRLLEVQAEEGADVARGDTLAVIDPSDYDLRLDAARAALSRARAKLDLVIAGARDESIEQARSGVREAEAAAGLADTSYARVRRLFEVGSVTRQRLDEAFAARERGSAALSAANEALAMLLRGNREQEVRMAQAQVDQVQAEAALAQRARENCSITSPAEGTVTVKVAEPGETVGAGSPVAVLSMLDSVWLSIYIPEPMLTNVALDDTAYVTIDGSSKVFGGRVVFISPEAEFTPRDVETPDQRSKLVYRVKIELPNKDGVFKRGMPADGYIGDRP
jgi:HlyD family secretion protein